MRQGAALILSLAFAASSPMVSAQAFEVSQLEAAQDFSAGPLNPSNGGFDPQIFSGQSAERVAHLISQLSGRTLKDDQAIWLRRLLLSAGVPPRAATPEGQAQYTQAITAAKLSLKDHLATDSLSESNNPLQRDAGFRAKLALSQGKFEDACGESDRNIEQRGEQFWMELRIFCHVTRGETAAAELTLNLISERVEKDPTFIGAANYALGLSPNAPTVSAATPTAKALVDFKNKGGTSTQTTSQAATTGGDDVFNAKLPMTSRLSALYRSGYQLSPEKFSELMSAFREHSSSSLAGSLDGTITAPESYDIASALRDVISYQKAPKAMGQLFQLSSNFSDPVSAANATKGLLQQADKNNYLGPMISNLSDAIQFITPEQQALLDPLVFSKTAIYRGDLNSLGGIYRALNGSDEKSSLAPRIALASDALGGGFNQGGFGRDIQTRLKSQNYQLKNRAIRDAMIAMALGARSEDKTKARLDQLETGKTTTANALEFARLQSLASSGARGETLLEVLSAIGTRKASQLSDFEIYSYITALRVAGLTREAGELAARDFISYVPQ